MKTLVLNNKNKLKSETRVVDETLIATRVYRLILLALPTTLRARYIVSSLRIVFERLPAWSYTVTDECLTRGIGGVGRARRRSKRFSQRIRAFDSLKAKKLSERCRGWKRWRGGLAVKARRRPTGGEGVRECPMCAMGGNRLHYVRDRAKLLGTWIIETELSHLCLQSSRYFKRSCTPDRTVPRHVEAYVAYACPLRNLPAISFAFKSLRPKLFLAKMNGDRAFRPQLLIGWSNINRGILIAAMYTVMDLCPNTTWEMVKLECCWINGDLT